MGLEDVRLVAQTCLRSQPLGRTKLLLDGLVIQWAARISRQFEDLGIFLNSPEALILSSRRVGNQVVALPEE